MRAVLDTNVVVSALIWGGVPLRLLEAATEGQVDLITSPALLAELAEVLNRPHLAKRLQRVRGTVEEALIFYAPFTISVTPDAVPRIVSGNPDDDHVIAAAVAGEADIIVSGDRHLLGLGTYQAIRIVTPANALISHCLQPSLIGLSRSCLVTISVSIKRDAVKPPYGGINASLRVPRLVAQ